MKTKVVNNMNEKNNKNNKNSKINLKKSKNNKKIKKYSNFMYVKISIFAFLSISSINLATIKYQSSNEYVNKNNDFLLYTPVKAEKNYINKTKILSEERKEDYFSKINKENRYTLFSTEKGLRSFKHKDKKSEKLREERNLNGEAERTFFETMKNFTEEEVAGKTHYLVTLANNKKVLGELKEREENYVSGKTDHILAIDMNLNNIGEKALKAVAKREITSSEKIKGNEKNKKDKEKENTENYTQEEIEKAKLEKWFYDIYEPVDMVEDTKTAVIACVFGNKKTGKLEIFYGGSNMPFSNMNSIKDWKNDIMSSVKVSKNYEAALEIAIKISKKVYTSKDGKKYQVLEAVNGFSKGGGEALYVASNLDLKALIIDPSPVVNAGRYIDNNKILAIVPGNGEAFLNRVSEITGTYGNLNTLEQKVGASEGKRGKKTSLIPAIPVSSQVTGMLRYHFPNINNVAESFNKIKKYIEKIKPIYNRFFE